MPVTTQETIESLKIELTQIAEHQAALKLNPDASNLAALKALEAQHQRLSQRLANLLSAQQNAKF